MRRVYPHELTHGKPLFLDEKTNRGTNSIFFQNSDTICDAN
jgi:hypothetical protein